MSTRKPMKRLLALRVMEEQREQTELRRQRQLRQLCLEALEASEARKAAALRVLHTALDTGDRAEAISAEMALACGPLERHALQRRLAQLDLLIEKASAAWQSSRVRRLQIETLVDAQEARSRREAQSREQKTIDGWFLTSRFESLAARSHENFQREVPGPVEGDGAVRATNL
jgi:flagellar biosynthesis chaperone FliJ